MQDFYNTRSNGLLTLKDSVCLISKLDSVKLAQVIVISINAQGLRDLMEELKEYSLKNKIIVLCMKGIEIGSGKRLSEIAEETLDASNHVAVWLGPGHVQEYLNNIPNCMVIDSESDSVKEKLVKEFSSELIRFYYGCDLTGNEVGAAAKNVIGIAAGMLDGLKLTTLKGALMSRGTREIARLIKAMGGSELSAYGLCHLGDYQATVFSEFSHNRKYGECLARGERYIELAEGYYTVKALIELGERYQVELPICKAVYDILYQKKDIHTILEQLFERDLKNEF
ncbi:glycerol-3-phosphate dehydrogenase [NAD(P)+] [Anaerocolumna chitinilytica]|uniref:Glycerol-3-phosphate dehydrogenase [NAD(P)+] n=2 Tax=Anaerocolumna chitinilytica TaxID=1727145 RepID=A0A7I8DLI6_9FIRM|nr:glycerol-3-phosphate dehydrogenase [NAD(P)+] [Anaerocolumna chitinilytica]